MKRRIDCPPSGRMKTTSQNVSIAPGADCVICEVWSNQGDCIGASSAVNLRIHRNRESAFPRQLPILPSHAACVHHITRFFYFVFIAYFYVGSKMKFVGWAGGCERKGPETELISGDKWVH
jgi:hypothetical protein